MALPRYRVHDAYIIAELQSRYESADAAGRVTLLTQLYADEDHQPLYEIALLAVTDPSVEVRRWVAKNARYLDYREGDKRRDSATLSDERNLEHRLATDPDPLVRASLRENPDILGVFSMPDDSSRWFRDSSHLERLALVRNPSVSRDLIAQLFDPEDQDLSIDLRLRFELCGAFLTNDALLNRITKEAGLKGHPASWDGWTWHTANKFLATLWENAAKWPKDSGDLPYAVFLYVPAPNDTKAKTYQVCQEPLWRRQIIYNSDADDEKTFQAALADTNDDCRKLAYERVTHLPEDQIDTVVKGNDLAALEGLADNRALAEPLQSKVHTQARDRLKQLGRSTSVYSHFDDMYIGAESYRKKATMSKVQLGDLYRRLRGLSRQVKQTDETLKQIIATLNRIYSLPSLLILAGVMALVVVLLLKWVR